MMPRFAKSQLGSKNKKNYSRGSGKINQTMNPWGKAVGFKARTAWGRVSGSSTRQPKSSPALAPQTAGYPRNDPLNWPVEPDLSGHTLPPSSSGLTAAVAARVNASVEQAYHRAGYQ